MNSANINRLWVVAILALFERAVLASASIFIARDGSAYCPPDEYVTENSLPFITYCGRNALSADLGYQASEKFTDCINACSDFAGCYGVTYYAHNQTCAFKSKDISDNSLAIADTDSINSALVNKTVMRPITSVCPYDNDTAVSVDGLQFQIYCQNDLPGADYIPWGHSYRLHAGTMKECMQHCTRAHPLCLGISWNPDKRNGYGNCYLKYSRDGTLTSDTPHVIHTGLVVALPEIDACSISGSTQISSNNKTFRVACSQGRMGSSNITSDYNSNIDSCIDQCASHSSGSCLGVLFDNSFSEGFENCYLLNVTGSEATAGISTPSTRSFTYAELITGNNSATTPIAPSSPPSSGSDDSNSEKAPSKAWIAGPVIGVIAAVALAIGGFLLWRRRRRRSAKRMASIEQARQEEKPVLAEIATRPVVHEMVHRPLHEVEGSNTVHE